jgi:anti-sigma-K factor RskA
MTADEFKDRLGRLRQREARLAAALERTRRQIAELQEDAGPAEATPEAECSDNQRRARFLAQAAQQAAREEARKERCRQERFSRPFPVMPRRPQ